MARDRGPRAGGPRTAVTSSPEPSDLRRLAEDLARAAGDLAAEGRRRSGAGKLAHETKSTHTDPVTVHDRAAEDLLVAQLRSRRPADGIVGEEGASLIGRSGIEWHVDPIDGTVNFLYGLPSWCTSVAAVDERGAIAGAVYAPALGEMYSAARGGGATLNGEPIHAAVAEELALSLVATGFSYDVERRREQGRRVALILGEVRDVRRSGSAALDLCAVAAGRVDAYFEENLNSWDVAAGALLAAEAGAVVSDLDGRPPTTDRILAAASGIHSALVDLLARTRHVPG